MVCTLIDHRNDAIKWNHQPQVYKSAGPRARLFKNWIAYSLDKPLSSTASVFDLMQFGGISTQVTDSYTFTFVLYKFHMATASFSYIFDPLDSSLSSG